MSLFPWAKRIEMDVVIDRQGGALGNDGSGGDAEIDDENVQRPVGAIRRRRCRLKGGGPASGFEGNAFDFGPGGQPLARSAATFRVSEGSSVKGDNPDVLNGAATAAKNIRATARCGAACD
ncbi:hypothetical protein [Bradyrhizobium sp. AZCC 1678]|uniref:hypothetical protein n=1 Tax=Bradyrhizobium sp. AZCC 1678 TaxID=3117030 RepID=UPI002FF20801